MNYKKSWNELKQTLETIVEIMRNDSSPVKDVYVRLLEIMNTNEKEEE